MRAQDMTSVVEFVENLTHGEQQQSELFDFINRLSALVETKLVEGLGEDAVKALIEPAVLTADALADADDDIPYSSAMQIVVFALEVAMWGLVFQVRQ